MALQKQAHPKHLEIKLTLQIHLRPPSDTQTSKQRHMRPIHTSLISFSGESVQMNKCTKKIKVMTHQSERSRARK